MSGIDFVKNNIMPANYPSSDNVEWYEESFLDVLKDYNEQIPMPCVCDYALVNDTNIIVDYKYNENASYYDYSTLVSVSGDEDPLINVMKETIRKVFSLEVHYINKATGKVIDFTNANKIHYTLGNFVIRKEIVNNEHKYIIFLPIAEEIEWKE